MNDLEEELLASLRKILNQNRTDGFKLALEAIVDVQEECEKARRCCKKYMEAFKQIANILIFLKMDIEDDSNSP